MTPGFRRCRALGAAAGALLVAKTWIYFAPGRAVRWGSRIGSTGRDFTGRGSRGTQGSTGRRGSLGLSVHGSHGFRRFVALIDPRDPRPVNPSDPRDPRPVDPIDPRDRRPVSDQRPVESIRDLSIAISAIGRRAPFAATCLEQGLALVVLLTLARIPAHLVVGVSRAGLTLRAHAWVESGGAVVHGGAEVPGFAPLVRPAPASSSPVASSCPG